VQYTEACIVPAVNTEVMTSLDEFVSRYLDDRRGQPTSILYLGSDNSSATVRSAFADPAWRFTSADPVDGRAALDGVRPQSVDVMITSEPLVDVDFPWVAVLQFARVLRPGGYGCFSLRNPERVHGSPETWREALDGVVELVEWANLEAVDLVADRDRPAEIPR
jgi:SAM-dependent methyltransferase